MDLNGDGHMDLISGSWPGETFFFRGGEGRTFAKPEMLRNLHGDIINIGGGVTETGGMLLVTGNGTFEHDEDGSSYVMLHGERIEPREGLTLCITGTASAVHAVDWEADGDLDLLIGDIGGSVYLVPNEGTATEYKFGDHRDVMSGGVKLKVAGDAGPCCADWDGDGDLDLLVGAGDGSVSWCRNDGQPGAPELAAPSVLVPPADRGETTEVRPGLRAKVCAADWNGDGLLDLLVGDYSRVESQSHGWVWIYRRKAPDSRGS